MREVDKKATSDNVKSKMSKIVQKKDEVAKNSEKPSAKTSVGRNKESAKMSKGKDDIVRAVTKGAYNGRGG